MQWLKSRSFFMARLTSKQALIHWEDGHEETVALARDYSVEIRASIPARSRIWLTVRAADAD